MHLNVGACKVFSGFSIGNVSEWQEVQQPKGIILTLNFADNSVAYGFMQKQLAWSNYFAVELENLVYVEDGSKTQPSTRHS